MINYSIRFLPLIFLLIVNFTSNAQNKYLVEGVVYNQDKEPLPFVTIIAGQKEANRHSTATISDSDGSFSLNILKGKEYVIEFSHAGYKRKHFSLRCDSVSKISIGDITLKKDTLLIKEVVVKPLLQVNEHEIIYNITADPERETANMMQIIDKLPKIYFDGKGRLKTENGGKILVTRNGKKDALFGGVALQDLLSKMPAMGFTQAKIILKPSPRYARIAEYVVDFSPDKSKRLIGVVASPTISYFLEDNSFSPSFGVAGSIDKVRFSGNSGISFINSPTNYYNRTVDNFEDNTRLNQKQENKKDGEKYNNCLALSVDLFKKHYLGASFAYNSTQTTLDATEKSILSGNSAVLNTLSSFKTSETNMENWSATIDYEFDFDKQERHLSLSYYMAASLKDETINFGNNQGDGNQSDLSKQKNRLNLDDQKLQLNYSEKFSKHTFLNGHLSYSERQHIDSWQQYNWIDRHWDESLNNYNHTKNITNILEGSAFCFFRVKKGINFDTRIGFNYPVNASRKLTSHKGIENEYANNNLLINTRNKISFSSKKKKLFDRISFSYGLSQQRPNYYHVSVNREQLSEAYFKVGNPRLKPEVTHSLGFSFRRKWFRPYFSFSFSDNKIGSILYQDTDGNTIQTYENNSKYRNYRMIIGKMFRKKGSRNSLMIGLTPEYSTFSVGGKTTEGAIISANTTVHFKITKHLKAFVNLRYYQSFIEGYQRARASKPIRGEVSFNYSLMRKGTPFARINLTTNPFGWGDSRRTNTFTSEQFVQTTETINRQLPLSINLVFVLGKFKAKNVRVFSNSAKTTGFSNESY